MEYNTKTGLFAYKRGLFNCLFCAELMATGKCFKCETFKFHPGSDDRDEIMVGNPVLKHFIQ